MLFADPNIIDFQVVLTGNKKNEGLLLKVEAVECGQEAVEAIRNRMLSDPLIDELVSEDHKWNLKIEFVKKKLCSN